MFLLSGKGSISRAGASVAGYVWTPFLCAYPKKVQSHRLISKLVCEIFIPFLGFKNNTLWFFFSKITGYVRFSSLISVACRETKERAIYHQTNSISKKYPRKQQLSNFAGFKWCRRLRYVVEIVLECFLEFTWIVQVSKKCKKTFPPCFPSNNANLQKLRSLKLCVCFSWRAKVQYASENNFQILLFLQWETLSSATVRGTKGVCHHSKLF